MRKTSLVTLLMALALFVAPSVQAATAFADPQFDALWHTGEAITPNFWGPLVNASGSRTQEYKDAAGGKRIVQYFDKGRMELTNGQVTSGLLAKEMVMGQIQTGDSTFTALMPANIPVAGDPNGQGATFIDVYGARTLILAEVPRDTGGSVHLAIKNHKGVNLKPVDGLATTGYDDATKHNIYSKFVDYRDKAGLSTIGYAISEPFLSYFDVGGKPSMYPVVVQIFERRILTYDLIGNVEMGNVGRQYFAWRNNGAQLS